MAIDLNNLSLGGLPSANEQKRRKEQRIKEKEANAASLTADTVRGLAMKVERLETHLANVERMLELQIRISEKQLIAINTLIPSDRSVLSISSEEVQARQRMGFGLYEKLSEQSIKLKFRKLAKRCHPDVAGSESRNAYETLESDRDLLLELVKSSGTT